MEIKNINTTPRFTGIYKLSNVDNKTIKDISSHMTLFAKVTNRPVYLFGGNHPLEGSVVNIINETVPECSRYSYEWLVQNAKNFGVTLPAAKNVDAWVFTYKDIDLVKDFLEISSKLVNKKKSFMGVLKKLFAASDLPEMQLPSHLRPLHDLLKENEQMTETFQRVIENKKVVEVNSLENLLVAVCQKG